MMRCSVLAWTLTAVLLAGCSRRALTYDQILGASEEQLADARKALWMTDPGEWGHRGQYHAAIIKSISQRDGRAWSEVEVGRIIAREAWNGMDADQLSWSWGRPHYSGREISGWGDVQRWCWGSEYDPHRVATLRNNRVIWWEIRKPESSLFE